MIFDKNKVLSYNIWMRKEKVAAHPDNQILGNRFYNVLLRRGVVLEDRTSIDWARLNGMNDPDILQLREVGTAALDKIREILSHRQKLIDTNLWEEQWPYMGA